METKYFNKLESGKIYPFIKTDPFYAAQAYEDYLERYPNDYYVYIQYIHTLNIIGKTKEALEVLEQVKASSSNNEHFLQAKDRVKVFNQMSALKKLEILANEEKYEESYQFYLDNFEDLKEYNLAAYLLYCQKKFGNLENYDFEEAGYLTRQITNYSDKEFLSHTEKHLSDCNNEPNDNLFVSGFPIKKIFKALKEIIPSDKRLYETLFADKYVFKYSECGREKNKIQDYFIVIAFRGSNELITMCPSANCQNLPYTDLNYLNHESEQKTKTLSQIEKFNRRYKRN
ncbi:MAG: hypothetical protein IJ093_01420 [Bacilli bacterium]|nr:hypothetical protein [Bacilli bacterium]